MRKLVITQNQTVDGAVEMLDDWFHPQSGAEDTELVEENRRQDDAADALLLGRRTFLDFRGYWRDLGDADGTGVSDYLNQVDKYVVSSTLTEPDWAHTTVLDGDPVAAVQELKDGPGTADIVLTGSIQLAHALIAAGLVDEYRLYTYPAVQGRGRRLFPEGSAVPHLELLEARTFPVSGISLQRWATAA